MEKLPNSNNGYLGLCEAGEAFSFQGRDLEETQYFWSLSANLKEENGLKL